MASYTRSKFIPEAPCIASTGCSSPLTESHSMLILHVIILWDNLNPLTAELCSSKEQLFYYHINFINSLFRNKNDIV